MFTTYTVLDNPVVKKHVILGFIYEYLKHFTFVSHFTRRISIIARIPKDRSFWGRE